MGGRGLGVCYGEGVSWGRPQVVGRVRQWVWAPAAPATSIVVPAMVLCGAARRTRVCGRSVAVPHHVCRRDRSRINGARVVLQLARSKCVPPPHQSPDQPPRPPPSPRCLRPRLPSRHAPQHTLLCHSRCRRRRHPGRGMIRVPHTRPQPGRLRSGRWHQGLATRKAAPAAGSATTRVAHRRRCSSAAAATSAA